MLKPVTACLVAAALTAAPALAQTGDRPTATGAGSTTAGSPSMRPGTSSDQTVTSPANPSTSTMGSTSSTGGSGGMGSGAPMTPSSTGTAAGGSSGGNMTSTTPSSGMSGNFIAQQQMGQMLASKLIGTTVVSQNNESIGDVNDVLFDRNGQVMAAVIGVGGFLGIGEKDVAVPFQQLEFMADANASGAATTGATGTAGTTATTGGAAPSTTGTMTTGTATTGTAGMTAAARDPMPNRVMLKMSKADLQAAPTFEEYGRTATTTTAPGAATTTAPRQ